MGSETAYPHPHRRLLRLAAAALCVWVLLVVAATCWRYPYFWIQAEEHYSRASGLFGSQQAGEAFRELDRAIDKAPENAGYHVYRGYRQLDARDAKGAEASFHSALRVAPDNPEARLGLARALIDQARKEDAVRELARLDDDLLNGQQLRRRSQMYGEAGAPAAALADLSRLLGDGSPREDLLDEALVHAVTLGDWPRVITLAERIEVVARDPAVRRRAAETRARAELRLGRHARAFEAYRVAQSPENLEIRAGLAWNLRRFDEAAALSAELQKQHPGDTRFVRLRAFALVAAGRSAEAEPLFRQLIETAAADLDVRRTYAWILNSRHRYAEAWAVLQLLPRPSTDPSLLELQTRTAVWAGQGAEVVQLAHALLRIRPDDAGLWKDLADAAESLGDTREAIAAMDAYLRLRSQDPSMRERLARILARSGSIERALEEYQQILAARPEDARAAEELGLLQETHGNLAAAAVSYARAFEHTASPSPSLLLRLARVHRWAGEPDIAAAWYRRYLAIEHDEARTQIAQGELALSLLDAGHADESLSLVASLETAPDNANVLLIGARAAAATGRLDRVARYLEQSQRARQLTAREQAWLAGTYRSLGRPADALRTYEQSLALEPSPQPATLEAIADLRYDAGDYRGAVNALLRVGNAADVRLKLARAAARAGDLEAADRGYAALADSPASTTDAIVEAARFFAAAGEPARSLRYYAVAIDRRGPGGLRLEMARIHLAAQQFAAAEGWARQALTAGEDAEAAQLVLAQALHIQGRHRDADLHLRALEAAAPDRVDTTVWRARVASALDRHYSGYQLSRRALAEGPDEGEQSALLMSSSARKRGDLARARIALDRAEALGLEAPLLASARRDLRVAVRPAASVPAFIHGDTNGLRLAQAGGGLAIFLPSLWGRLSIDATSGTLSQRVFSTVYSSVRASLAQIFLTPRLELGTQLGLHAFERRQNLVSLSGTATWHVTDGTFGGVTVAHEPVLPLAGPSQLRQFNRILDLAAAGPDFARTALRGFAEFFTNPTRRAHVEVERARLDDGNHQALAYVHYQIPLADSVRHWTVVRPNVFFETFQARRPAYFSPKHHLTVGTMLHTQLRYPHWDLELELNPQLLRTDGANGWGAHGLVGARFTRGRASVDLGTFLFYDGLEEYLQWRVGGRLTMRIGQ